jgi:hypothetical protein
MRHTVASSARACESSHRATNGRNTAARRLRFELPIVHLKEMNFQSTHRIQPSVTDFALEMARSLVHNKRFFVVEFSVAVPACRFLFLFFLLLSRHCVGDKLRISKQTCDFVASEDELCAQNDHALALTFHINQSDNSFYRNRITFSRARAREISRMNHRRRLHKSNFISSFTKSSLQTQYNAVNTKANQVQCSYQVTTINTARASNKRNRTTINANEPVA